MIIMGLPDDAAVLAAIGKIAIRHGQLDYALRLAVKSLADVTIEEALDATERQGSRDLRDRVRKLAKQRLGEGQAFVKLDALLERARRATESRNVSLHSLWARLLDGAPKIRDARKGFQDIPTVEELEKVAEELYSVMADITKARMDGFLAEALKKPA